MADDKMYYVEIISPDRVFYKGQVNFLEIETTEGRIGIYKNHIPLTSVIKPGIVKLFEEEVRKAAIHDGFIQVYPDKVTIMAEIAEWPDEIDLNRAMEAKTRAERNLKSGGSEVNLSRAEAALKRSLARIELKQ